METQAQEAIEKARQALKAKIQIYDMDAHVIESDDDLRPIPWPAPTDSQKDSPSSQSELR